MHRGRKPNSEKEKEKEMDYEDYIKEYYSEDKSSKRKKEIKIIQRKLMYKKRLQKETLKQIIEHLHAIENTFHTIKTANEMDVTRQIQFTARFEPMKEKVQDYEEEEDFIIETEDEKDQDEQIQPDKYKYLCIQESDK
ncbi:hypothetical protein M9Y10_044116 [Tritrichomonas musculus]|uniref:Uncharacterized protein n=1 Tax=Tritrichomonas musculus TaxID=1915356 RepID=A0ABR2K2J3_9EUKA